MGCLTPPRYLTKRTAPSARPCQREASAKADKVMRPYAAEGWQGAASTSLTAPRALWTAAEAVGSVLLVLAAGASGKQSSGTLGSWTCVTAPHANAQHAYECTTQRASVASIGTLRITFTEHRRHTQWATQQQQRAASRTKPLVFRIFVLSVCYLLFVAVFQTSRILFPIGNRNYRFGFSQAVPNPILVWFGEQRLGPKPPRSWSSANTLLIVATVVVYW